MNDYMSNHGYSAYEQFSPFSASLDHISPLSLSEYNIEAASSHDKNKYQGFPYPLNVAQNTDAVRTSGFGLGFLPVLRLAHFSINAQDTGDGPINVHIKGPDGRECPCSIYPQGGYIYRVEWTPQVVGDHRVDIQYNGLPIGGSPFNARVYDSSKVVVSHIGKGRLGKQANFKVDASRAGAGNLEVIVSVRGENVPNFTSAEGNAKYLFSFTPQVPEPHKVSVRFNEEPVPGSPFTVEVLDLRNVSVHGDGLQRCRVGNVGSFDVDPNGPIAGELEVRITSPSGQQTPCRITNGGSSGGFECQFQPQEVGRHVMDIQYAAEPLLGSPYYCEVYDASRVRVTDFTPDPKINQEISFIVDSSQAGNGEIDVEIINSRNDCLIRARKDNIGNNRWKYSFVPTEYGEYLVNVAFNDENVPGTPTRLQIAADHQRFSAFGQGVSSLNANTVGRFTVEGPQGSHRTSASGLEISITAPNGQKLPVNVAQGTNGQSLVDWNTPYIGRHIVEVKVGSQHINGSPYPVNVFDPSRVQIENSPRNTMLNGDCAFNVLTSEAGQSNLDVSVTGPSGPVPVSQQGQDPTYRISFSPKDEGVHIVSVKYGGVDVPGTPFPIHVLDGAGNVQAFGDGLTRGEEGRPSIFHVDTKGHRGDLKVNVEGPNTMAKCSISHDGKLQKVSYTPVEVGVFKIHISFNGREIKDSPFHPHVVCPRKIRPVSGWQNLLDNQAQMQLKQGEEKRVTFDTREAGPGSLKAEVYGPDMHQVPCSVERADDNVVFRFTPTQEGEYKAHLSYEGVPLPGSPFRGQVVKKTTDREKVTTVDREQRVFYPGSVERVPKVYLKGRGLRETRADQTAEFTIDGCEAGLGKPKVSVRGPAGECPVQLVREGDSFFRCTYHTAHEGAHVVSVFWNDKEIKGSPFKVHSLSAADASKVALEGETLKGGYIDREIHTRIDTRKAGYGDLTALCMGPTREAKCTLIDQGSGVYSLTIRPSEAGRHVVKIKYGGYDISGSPFILMIQGHPDPSKVTVNGPGIQDGYLSNFRSNFYVNTSGAGPGKLTVCVRGPKGGFKVEMQRESPKDRTIVCSYDPTEPGEYTVHVKWSGKHVPGSPFNVNILGGQDDFQQPRFQTIRDYDYDQRYNKAQKQVLF